MLFWLDIQRRYNIYNVLVNNPYLSALIYFVGLSVTLLSGYFFKKYQ